MPIKTTEEAPDLVTDKVPAMSSNDLSDEDDNNFLEDEDVFSEDEDV